MDIATIGVIVAGLGAVSEALSLIPAVRANGVFQAVWNILRFLGRKPAKTNVVSFRPKGEGSNGDKTKTDG